jgi:hypothetical protein
VHTLGITSIITTCILDQQRLLHNEGEKFINILGCVLEIFTDEAVVEISEKQCAHTECEDRRPVSKVAVSDSHC